MGYLVSKNLRRRDAQTDVGLTVEVVLHEKNHTTIGDVGSRVVAGWDDGLYAETQTACTACP
ncbi:hypothetical protein COMA2_40139 [Candidatus Nitrospira nitrificans]|uniref:Uncharacterized protein n=1 Tax=Candidatus Nitrospira nitrificans TaxID=1742973 RepID=A0A0S4LKH1_9BACT|nr:hypothetical protein COMA2_40139 [Candidatus Nitrospira nitrificans]